MPPAGRLAQAVQAGDPHHFGTDASGVSGAKWHRSAAEGQIFIDTPQAQHEAGDLLQAGLEPVGFPTLREVVLGEKSARSGPVLFKSCGCAGWDLAAARTAVLA